MKPANVSFSDFTPLWGQVGDFIKNKDAEFPTLLHHWRDSLSFSRKHSTLLGFVSKGKAILQTPEWIYPVSEGMYFSVPLDKYEQLEIVGGEGFIAERIDYEGFFQIGGKVEQNGRLKYIDGCTDSLLIPPVKLGDPCLNLLVFPPKTNQTAHTHPSIRLGMVISGKGFCVTPEGEIPLYAGQVFAIHTDGIHAFRTEGETMRVVAYHPDSDYGPSDEEHPMLNRTIVNGISAKHLDDIRTK